MLISIFTIFDCLLEKNKQTEASRLPPLVLASQRGSFIRYKSKLTRTGLAFDVIEDISQQYEVCRS
jgi:hypothetical protein